jgi:ribonuclease HI
MEYMEIFGKKSSASEENQLAWRPPAQGVIKLNIDGAFTPGLHHAGWGVIARGHKGDVVATTTGRSNNVTDAFHAELMAAVKALRLAEHLGAICVVLETDSQLLMLALNRRGPDASPQAMIIDDLKFQIRTNYSLCDVVACKHELNKPAHELARIGWSCDVNMPLLWEYEVPASIAGLVRRDALIKFKLSLKKTILHPL